MQIENQPKVWRQQTQRTTNALNTSSDVFVCEGVHKGVYVCVNVYVHVCEYI